MTRNIIMVKIFSLFSRILSELVKMTEFVCVWENPEYFKVLIFFQFCFLYIFPVLLYHDSFYSHFEILLCVHTKKHSEKLR